MKPFPLNVIFVFFVVTIGALIAIVLGGAFGYAAGLIGPDIFANLLPWEKFEPVGVATVVGAFGASSAAVPSRPSPCWFSSWCRYERGAIETI